MESFIRALLQASVTGGVLIMVALLLRMGLKNILPKRFLMMLWAAVLLNLLLVIGVPSPTSIYNYVGLGSGTVAATSTPPAVALPPSPAPDHPIPLADGPGVLPAESYASPRAEGSIGAWQLVFGFWLAGVLLLIIVYWVHYYRCATRFDTAFLLKDNVAVADWARGKQRPVKVYVSDLTTTPITFGIFRPRIILPRLIDLGDATLLTNVLEHEYAHCRLFHNAFKSLVYLGLAVHWFNPLVWLYCLLFSHDAELACDEHVIGVLGTKRRADYARSLVSVAESALFPMPMLSAFGARSIKERVIDIMTYRPASTGMTLSAALVAMTFFLLFGTAPFPAAAQVLPPDAGPPPTAPATAIAEGGDAPASSLTVALAAAGGGLAIKKEVEIEGGREIHEFDIINNQQLHEIRVDYARGAIIAHFSKTIIQPVGEYAALKILTIPEAEAIALKAAGRGLVDECELKRSLSGTLLYEVEIVDGLREIEITLDAVTGRLIGMD